MQYACSVTKNVQIRDVPDRVHRKLVRRAREEGMSLSRYALGVLESHIALPTFDEWLAELDEVEPVVVTESAATAVKAGRAENDTPVARGRRRR